MATETETAVVPVSQGETGELSKQALSTGARNTWRVNLDILQSNLSHNAPEAQELFTWCFLWCIDDAHPVTLEEFALQVNSDKTTISRIAQGTYKHPTSGARMPISDRLLKAMKQFRELALERSRETRTGFVPTPTSRKIWVACDLARESRSPVFLIGPSHVGKTWALTEYKEANNHGATIYVRMNAASGLMGMVRTIASSLGFSERAPTPELLIRIKKTLARRPNTLLLLDEVHQLFHTYKKTSFFACLEVLREIYDETGIGMVFCGTELLLSRVSSNRGELEQLLRRGVHKVILPDQPQKGDVAAIAEALGLDFPAKGESVTVRVGGAPITDQPFDILKQIGREEGLKAITERLRYATKIANRAKETLTWAHFVRAHHTIRQNSVAGNDWEN